MRGRRRRPHSLPRRESCSRIEFIRKALRHWSKKGHNCTTKFHIPTKNSSDDTSQWKSRIYMIFFFDWAPDESRDRWFRFEILHQGGLYACTSKGILWSHCDRRSGVGLASFAFTFYFLLFLFVSVFVYETPRFSYPRNPISSIAHNHPLHRSPHFDWKSTCPEAKKVSEDSPKGYTIFFIVFPIRTVSLLLCKRWQQ